jgi:hypothetical protein
MMATILSIGAFIIYNWRIFSGQSHANFISWAIWAFVTALNFTSYKSVSGSWIKAMLPTVDSGLCILTALVLLFLGRIGKMNVTDMMCLMLGIVTIILWRFTKSARLAQVLVQVALVIGFIPTYHGMIIRNTEPWLPWLMWAVAFVGQFAAVNYNRRTDENKKGEPYEFLYPVNMAIFHFGTFIMAAGL